MIDFQQLAEIVDFKFVIVSVIGNSHLSFRGLERKAA